MVDLKTLFTDSQKAIITSLLIEMANIDGIVVISELATYNEICRQVNITTEIFEHGKSLDAEKAIEMAKDFTDIQKIELAKLLVKMIDADQKDDKNEIRFLNHVCKKLEIDNIL